MEEVKLSDFYYKEYLGMPSGENWDRFIKQAKKENKYESRQAGDIKKNPVKGKEEE